MNENKDKIAFVTGGAVGIGAAVCERLARAGMHVVVADLDLAGAGETVARIRAEGGSAHAQQVDIGKPESIAEAFAQLRASHGRCDVLVNNAGIAKTYPFLEFPLDNWLATMNINVTGTLLCSQHAGRMMAERGWGRIVSIASVAGMRAVGKGRTAYGTSKAAVIGLTRQMAAELVEHGITANAVAPGPVDTPMTQVLHSAEFRRQYASAIPANRYGLTTEIAAAVAFLASDEAGYINGVALPVDGGFMATGARGV
jgi:NAD(P)-dependent dehydrogenase (short-subunit alcohol dehydrogenase family)